MNDQLLQRIEQISLMKHNRDLFQTLCFMDITIIRTNGIPLHSDQEQGACVIPENILDALIKEKRPRQFQTSDHLKHSVVPIILSDVCIGFVMTREHSPDQMNQGQWTSITHILEKLTEYALKNELHPTDIKLAQHGTMTRQQELLNRAVHYIRQNYHSTQLTLRDVSLHNGISYHYLSRIFKKELDTTFAQFRNHVRMEAAQKMLKRNHIPICQISYACGFDDPAYFCKVFRSFSGNSPSHYRRQFCIQNPATPTS